MAKPEKITFEPAYDIGEMVMLVTDPNEDIRKWVVAAYFVQKSQIQYVITNGDDVMTVFDILLQEYPI